MPMQNRLAAEISKALALANVEMMVLTLPDTKVADISPAALRNWNCSRDEIIGKPLAKFGTGPLSARYIQDDHATDTPQRIEVCFAPPLGHARSILFTPQALTDSGNDLLLLIGQHGEKKMAIEAIQNERRLALALRSGGYAVWDYDYRSGTTTNSPEMYDILGFTRDSPELDFEAIDKRVHPDDREKTLGQQIRSAPFGADMFQTKYRVKSHTGDYMWIESIAGVIRDPIDGKPAKVAGLCRNINDQMAAVEKIHMSERNLKRTQAAAKLGSFVYRVSTGAAKLSAEMIAQLGLESSIVPPTLAVLENMMEASDRERFREAIDQAKAGKRVSGLEIAVKLKSGEIQYFQCNIDPERAKEGAIESLFATCQVITERKMLEKKYLQAQKMEAVGQLTGGIAHDFNNLLMVVMGNLQLVEGSAKDDPKIMKRVLAAMEATEKGSQLTKRMLAFSRQQTLQNKDIEVNDLVDRMQGMLHQAIGENVALKLMPGEQVWPIRADATQLETAILNLAINARDAMKPKGGSLMIETSNCEIDQAYCDQNEDVDTGDYVQIAVTDTGAGIPPENIEKVFQPFFTTKGPEAGSGLGLSMIYGFVKQSGGHVKIYSEIGHGTSVKLFLPRTKADIASQTVAGPINIPLVSEQETPFAKFHTGDEPAPAVEVVAVAADPVHELSDLQPDRLSALFSGLPSFDQPAEIEIAEAAAPQPVSAPAPEPIAQITPPQPAMMQQSPARSTFGLVAPVSPPSEPRALQETLAQSFAAPAPVQKPKTLVLVVEDNEAVREVAAAMIEEMGYATLQAANGAEGLAAIETRPDIDLLLSDVIMAGGMNGPELAARALKIRPELRLLFMSGYAPGSVRQMQDLPAHIDLVNKPFTRSDLADKVNRALAA